MKARHVLPLVLALALGVPTLAEAAIAFRAAASRDLNGTSTSLVINVPAGTVKGDVMVALIAVRPSTATITPPAAFTLLARVDQTAGNTNALAVYTRVVTGSEPASYTWTIQSGNTGNSGGIMSFSGVDNSSPVDVYATALVASGTSFPAPSVTTTVANTMIVTGHEFSSAERWTPPAGMTERVDVASVAVSQAGGIALEGAHVLQALAGPSGTMTATVPGNVDTGATATLALRPVVCGAVSDAGYVSATATSGQAIVYWGSAGTVTVLRKSSAFTSERPVDGVPYSVGESIGAATVVYAGSGTTFTETGLTNGTGYHYKVFVRNATPCYSTGVAAKATPAAGPVPAWSYTMAGGSLLNAGITGVGTIYTSSNAGRVVSLSTANGTQSWTPLGTTAAVQGTLTWLPVGRRVVRSIQSGTATMPVGATDAPQTVTVGAAQGFAGVSDLSRSILFFTLRGSSNQPGDGQVRGRLASTSTIEFNRANDTSLGPLTIRWYVVELYSAVSVQRGSLTTTDTSTASISAVDPAKSFVLVSCEVVPGDSTYGSDDYFRAQLTAATTLEVVHSTTAAKTCDWQVVEYAGASVQRGTGTLAGAAASSGPIAISAVDTAASFVQVTWRTSGNGTGANFLRARLTGASTIEIDRSVTGTTIEYAWEVVSFTDGTTVRTGTKGFTGSELSGTDPIAPAVDPTRSVAFATAYQRGGMHAYTADDDVGPGWVTVTIANATTVNLERAITGAVAANVAWVVIEFPQTTGAPTAFAGDQSGRVYAVDTGTGLASWTVALTGADAVQAATAAQLRSYANAAFQAAYTDDVLFAATRNASSTNNKVFALRAADGAVLWTFNDSGAYSVDYIVGMPYVDYLRNRLYVTSRAGAAGTQASLWVLNTLTGELVQPFAVGHVETSASLSGDYGTLYVGNQAGSLYAFDTNAVALKWTGPYALGAALKGYVWEDWSTAGRIYFSTADGNVWCLQDTGSGASLQWKQPVAGASTPLLLEKIYVGSSDGKVHQLNPTSGVDEKQVTIGDGTATVGDVSTEDGLQVFVGTTAGTLYKLPLPLP